MKLKIKNSQKQGLAFNEEEFAQHVNTQLLKKITLIGISEKAF